MPLTPADLTDFDEHTPPPRTGVRPPEPPPRFVRVGFKATAGGVLARWVGGGRVDPRAVCVPALAVPAAYRRWRFVADVEVGSPSHKFRVLQPPEGS